MQRVKGKTIRCGEMRGSVRPSEYGGAQMLRTRLPKVAIILFVLLSFLQIQPAVALQSQRDAEAAAQEAIELSELESKGRASSLYRRLHPDAQEIIPKEAVVGWYETDFIPLNPQPIIEITGVEFVTWTWPVTGVSYRNTAEVSYVQPFGSGANVTYTEEVVRLVEEDGDWHWFFGRSLEFVETQITRFSSETMSSEPPSRTESSSPNTSANSVYSLSVSCSHIEAVVGDVVYAYCDWPFMLSAPFYCMVVAYDPDSNMGMFMCNPAPVPDFQNPDEMVLDFAPKLIYTVQVHCDVYTEGYQKFTDCDWPLFGPTSPECVIDESRLTFPYEQYLLCKP